MIRFEFNKFRRYYLHTESEIENFDFDTRDKEVGTVIWVGDGIVTIYGIDNAMYGEIVVFEMVSRVWYRISEEPRSDVSCSERYRNKRRYKGYQNR